MKSGLPTSIVHEILPGDVSVPIRPLFGDDTNAHAAIGLYWIVRYLHEHDDNRNTWGGFTLAGLREFVYHMTHTAIVDNANGKPETLAALPFGQGCHASSYTDEVMNVHVPAVLSKGIFLDLDDEYYAPTSALFDFIIGEGLNQPGAATADHVRVIYPARKEQ